MSDEKKKKISDEEGARNFSKSLDEPGDGGGLTDEYMKSLSYTERRTWTPEEKKENLEKLEKELEYLFYNALNEYSEKRSMTLLEKTSPDTKLCLRDELKKLWLANVKRYGWGWHGSECYWLEPISMDFGIKKNKIKRDLVQHGKDYEPFWFKKKNLEVLIEIFENYAEQKLKEDMDTMLVMLFGVGNSKKLSEGEVQEMSDKIKKGNKEFIADLKNVRAQLTETLLGLENRLRRFALVWLPYLTFAAVIIFGAVGLSKEGQCAEAVMIALGFVGITLLGFYRMNK